MSLRRPWLLGSCSLFAFCAVRAVSLDPGLLFTARVLRAVPEAVPRTLGHSLFNWTVPCPCQVAVSMVSMVSCDNRSLRVLHFSSTSGIDKKSKSLLNPTFKSSNIAFCSEIIVFFGCAVVGAVFVASAIS